MRCTTPAIIRLQRRTRTLDNGCIEFIGDTRAGYGRIWNGDRNDSTHRVAWEAVNGPIPDDMFLDHLCRNRLCCNPEHLELVSKRTNTVRALIVVKHKKRTPYIGVRTMRDKFQARISVNGVHHYLGVFTTPEAAARAYDTAVRELIDPDAPTNESLGLLKAAS